MGLQRTDDLDPRRMRSPRSIVGGDRARVALDSTKESLAVHNAAVMTVLFLVFDVELIAEGLPVLGG